MKIRSQHIVAFLAILFIAGPLNGQIGLTQSESPVNIEIRLSPQVTNAQTINLTTLGIDNRGRGDRLFDLIIENKTNAQVNDLFLDVIVSTSTRGVIAEIYTENFAPFSLRPNQVVIGNNNSLQTGLPGIANTNVNGRLTSSGEDLINELTGATRLPEAIYSVKVAIYQGQNRWNGGQLLAYAYESVGTRAIQNVVDFFLIQPGGSLGSRELLTSRIPIFRWDGPQDIQYRLIVVEDNGQNPQSLIQGALSTEATIGMSATGTRLLEYEMIDALVVGTSFQYPPTGSPALRQGNRYFWQIFARIPTTSGFEIRPSEILEFTIPSPDSNPAQEALADETLQLLRSLSPQVASRINTLVSDGYEVASLEIDGRILSGPTLISFLEEFIRRMEEGQITIVN